MRLHRDFSLLYGQACGFVYEVRNFSAFRWRVNRVAEFLFVDAAGGGFLGRIPGVCHAAHVALSASATWAHATSVVVLQIPVSIAQAGALNHAHVLGWASSLVEDGGLYRDPEDGDIYDSNGRLLSTACPACGVRVPAWQQCSRDALASHEPDCDPSLRAVTF